MFGNNDTSIRSSDIFNKVSDLDIYSYYLGYTPTIGKTISSPFRPDKNPSFSIFKCKYSNKLRWKDITRGDKGDSIDFVKMRFNATYYEALCIIDTDFALGLKRGEVLLPSMGVIGTSDSEVDSYIKEAAREKVIQVRTALWGAEAENYWKQYGISLTTLDKFNVYNISHYWINENRFSIQDLGFVYFFGDKCKIYQPLNKKFKWCSNSGDVIQGYSQLPKTGDVLVITKSLKDAMVLYEFGIPAIAFHSEVFFPGPEIIEEFTNRFTHVVSNYDWDRAGQHTAWRLRDEYGIPAYMLTNHGSKDLSDYCVRYGVGSAKKLIDKLEI